MTPPIERPVKWWYFTWTALTADMDGSMCLPMMGEFDFLAAHKWIEDNMGVAAMLTWFVEVSAKQAKQYQDYTVEYSLRSGASPQGREKFRLIRGEKPEDEPKPPGGDGNGTLL
jgi:hypothetical protein